MDGGHGYPPAVTERWEEFMADTRATAEEYEQEGYEALAIHPGDVLPLPDDLAIDVLAPGDEYRTLQEMAEELSVDSFEVYGASQGGVEFALIVPIDHETEKAVCVPVFLADEAVEKFGPEARAAGHVHLHVRPLSDDSRVEFTLQDPDLLF